MREKKLSLIITFNTTTDAMAMEKICGDSGLSGRLIPVPREITAGCGMSWKSDTKDRDILLSAAQSAKIEVSGTFEMMV